MPPNKWFTHSLTLTAIVVKDPFLLGWQPSQNWFFFCTCIAVIGSEWVHVSPCNRDGEKVHVWYKRWISCRQKTNFVKHLLSGRIGSFLHNATANFVGFFCSPVCMETMMHSSSSSSVSAWKPSASIPSVWQTLRKIIWAKGVFIFFNVWTLVTCSLSLYRFMNLVMDMLPVLFLLEAADVAEGVCGVEGELPSEPVAASSRDSSRAPLVKWDHWPGTGRASRPKRDRTSAWTYQQQRR